MKAFILGHRGVGKGAHLPENTLLSFKSALESGINKVECDIRKTKDGKIVVFHDDTLDRTTNGKGKLNSYTFEEIQKFDAGKSEKIPTIEELLKLVKSFKGTKLFIEYKENDCEKEVVELINNMEMKQNVNMISFHFNILKNIKKLDKEVEVGLLLHDGNNLSQVCDELVAIGGSNIGLAYTSLKKEHAELIKSKGLLIWCWNPRNESEVLNALDCGVQGMGSNNLKMTSSSFEKYYSQQKE